MYYGVTYDLDLTNEVAVRYGLNQGEEICISYDERDDEYPLRLPEEITVSVGQGGRYRDSELWYADLTFTNSNDDLRNSRFEEFDTKEDALNLAMAWVRMYRDS